MIVAIPPVTPATFTVASPELYISNEVHILFVNWSGKRWIAPVPSDLKTDILLLNYYRKLERLGIEPSMLKQIFQLVS